MSDQPPASEPKAPAESHTASHLTLPTLAFAFIAVGIVGAAIAFGDYLFSSQPHLAVTSFVGAVGFALTSSALGLAYAIYSKQDRDSAAQAERVNDQLVALGSVTDRLEDLGMRTHEDVRTVISSLDAMGHATPDEIESDTDFVRADAGTERDLGMDPPDSPGETPDDSDDDDDDQEGSRSGGSISLADFALLGLPPEKFAGLELYAGPDIPLRPLATLMNGLSANPEYAKVVAGTPEKLKPADLAAYRMDKQGPKVWYIVVPTAPGRGRGAPNRRGRSIWRVSVLTDRIVRLDDEP